MDEDGLDIYGDLDDFASREEQKTKEYAELEKKYEATLKEIESLKLANKQKDKEIMQMKLNFQALLDTAKMEIERKDRRIAELNKEKDDICFRRKRPRGEEETHYKEETRTSIHNFDQRKTDHISRNENRTDRNEPAKRDRDDYRRYESSWEKEKSRHNEHSYRSDSRERYYKSETNSRRSEATSRESSGSRYKSNDSHNKVCYRNTDDRKSHYSHRDTKDIRSKDDYNRRSSSENKSYHERNYSNKNNDSKSYPPENHTNDQKDPLRQSRNMNESREQSRSNSKPLQSGNSRNDKGKSSLVRSREKDVDKPRRIDSSIVEDGGNLKLETSQHKVAVPSTISKNLKPSQTSTDIDIIQKNSLRKDNINSSHSLKTNIVPKSGGEVTRNSKYEKTSTPSETALPDKTIEEHQKEQSKIKSPKPLSSKNLVESKDPRKNHNQERDTVKERNMALNVGHNQKDPNLKDKMLDVDVPSHTANSQGTNVIVKSSNLKSFVGPDSGPHQNVSNASRDPLSLVSQQVGKSPLPSEAVVEKKLVTLGSRKSYPPMLGKTIGTERLVEQEMCLTAEPIKRPNSQPEMSQQFFVSALDENINADIYLYCKENMDFSIAEQVDASVKGTCSESVTQKAEEGSPSIRLRERRVLQRDTDRRQEFEGRSVFCPIKLNPQNISITNNLETMKQSANLCNVPSVVAVSNVQNENLITNSLVASSNPRDSNDVQQVKTKEKLTSPKSFVEKDEIHSNESTNLDLERNKGHHATPSGKSLKQTQLSFSLTPVPLEKLKNKKQDNSPEPDKIMESLQKSNSSDHMLQHGNPICQDKEPSKVSNESPSTSKLKNAEKGAQDEVNVSVNLDQTTTDLESVPEVFGEISLCDKSFENESFSLLLSSNDEDDEPLSVIKEKQKLLSTSNEDIQVLVDYKTTSICNSPSVNKKENYADEEEKRYPIKDKQINIETKTEEVMESEVNLCSKQKIVDDNLEFIANAEDVTLKMDMVYKDLYLSEGEIVSEDEIMLENVKTIEPSNCKKDCEQKNPENVPKASQNETPFLTKEKVKTIEEKQVEENIANIYQNQKNDKISSSTSSPKDINFNTQEGKEISKDSLLVSSNHILSCAKQSYNTPSPLSGRKNGKRVYSPDDDDSNSTPKRKQFKKRRKNDDKQKLSVSGETTPTTRPGKSEKSNEETVMLQGEETSEISVHPPQTESDANKCEVSSDIYRNPNNLTDNCSTPNDSSNELSESLLNESVQEDQAAAGDTKECLLSKTSEENSKKSSKRNNLSKSCPNVSQTSMVQTRARRRFLNNNCIEKEKLINSDSPNEADKQKEPVEGHPTSQICENQSASNDEASSTCKNVPQSYNHMMVADKDIERTLENLFDSPSKPLADTSLNDSPKRLAALESSANNLTNCTIDETFVNHSPEEKNDSLKSQNLSSDHNTSGSSLNISKTISLGSSEYQFEQISENVVKLYVTRKKRRKI